MARPSVPTPDFRVGDRVQLILPQTGISVGAIGTVVSRFLIGPLYDVQFDGHPGPRVVEARYLAPAPPGPSDLQ